MRNAELVRQLGGEKRGLVVAAFGETTRVQRNRHDEIDPQRRVTRGSAQEMSERAPEVRPAAVLEATNRRFDGAAVEAKSDDRVEQTLPARRWHAANRRGADRTEDGRPSGRPIARGAPGRREQHAGKRGERPKQNREQVEEQVEHARVIDRSGPAVASAAFGSAKKGARPPRGPRYHGVR